VKVVIPLPPQKTKRAMMQPPTGLSSVRADNSTDAPCAGGSHGAWERPGRRTWSSRRWQAIICVLHRGQTVTFPDPQSALIAAAPLPPSILHGGHESIRVLGAAGILVPCGHNLGNEIVVVDNKGKYCSSIHEDNGDGTGGGSTQQSTRVQGAR
jgi:hypothetical protein